MQDEIDFDHLTEDDGLLPDTQATSGSGRSINIDARRRLEIYLEERALYKQLSSYELDLI